MPTKTADFFRKIPHAHCLWEVARAIPLGSRSIYIRYTMARLDEVRKNLDGLAKTVGLLGFPLKL